MNKVFKKVWSVHLGAYIAVAETTKGHGKSSAGVVGAALIGALLALPMQSQAVVANTLPTGGQVTAGTASINTAGDTLTVNQSSQRAAINWQSFSVGANGTVNFVQPNASSVTLNRVVGSEQSVISGALNANGQVFLLNSNGVLFTRGAQVNVGGIVASTLGLTDADFKSGKSNFTSTGATGSVVNLGALNAADGGYVALLGNHVANEGVITARLGTAILAGGDKVSLSFNGDSLVGVTIEQGALNALVENKQAIRADGGSVVLTAKGLDTLLATVVNNTGEIRAQTVSNKDGKIYLLGGMTNDRIEVGGTLDASAPNGGNGGFIETSSAKVVVSPSVHITTSAPQGSSGHWLIDPVDIMIAPTGGDITGATIATALGATNVTLDSSGSGSCSGATCGALAGGGDITVNDNITVTNNTGANTTLTLNAYRDLYWNGGTTFDARGGAKGVNLVLNANTGGTGQGGIWIAGSAQGGSLSTLANIYTNGGDFTATTTGVTYAQNSSIELQYLNLDAGNGSVTIIGRNANTGTGTYDSRHGVALDGDSYIKASAITITGENNNPDPNAYVPISLSGGTFVSTGSGGVTLNAINSTSTGVGLGLRTYPGVGVTYLLSASGPIKLNSSNITLDFDYSGSSAPGIHFGAEPATAVTSSTADVIITSDAIAALGVMSINTSGLFKLQSSGPSFTSTPTLDFSGLSIVNMGGLVIGKSSNTSNLILTLPEINGPVTINATNTTLNSSLTSTNGDVTLNTGIDSTSSIAIVARNGNINLNGDISTTDATTNAIYLNAGQLKSAGDATGGNILVTGSHTTTTGAGGLALLYSGSNSGSTGLDAVAGNNIRFGADETTSTSAISPSINNSGIYAIYRQSPVSLSYTLPTVSGSYVYDGTYQVPSNWSANSIFGSSYANWSLGTDYKFSYNSLDVVGFKSATTYTPISISILKNGYSVASSGNTNGSFTISPKAITIGGFSTGGKVYDGFTTAAIVGSASLQTFEAPGSGTSSDGKAYSGDTVSLSGTLSAHFNTKDVATANIISYSGLSLSGADAGNYSLTQPANLSANIAAKALTVTGSAAGNKTYDGTTTASITGGSLVGVVNGDTVNLTQAGNFSDKNVGNGKSITLADSLSGTDAGNYSITQPANLSANIAAKTLTVTGSVAGNKTYDGTTTASITGGSLVGVVNGDTVNLTQAGNFSDKNVGNGKSITLADSISGTDSGNYSITQPANLSANISPATALNNAISNAITVPQANVASLSAVAGLVGVAPQSVQVTPFANVANPPASVVDALGQRESFGLISSPRANEPTLQVMFSQANGMLRSPQKSSEDVTQVERNVRVPASRNSQVEIVNGGVRLPPGLEQVLYVVSAD